MVVGIGTLLNTSTVLAGGTVGALAGDRIPERLRVTVVQSLALFAMVYGVKTAITPQFADSPAADLAIVLIALLLGTVTGSLLDLDGAVRRLGAALQRRLSPGHPESDEVARGFVTASLLFCIGPLTLLGSLADGTHGDVLLLGVKSGMDGFTAMAFAASMGWGVLLSAGSVFVVQGSLTALAYATRGTFDSYLVTQALGAGGIMLLAIGITMMEIRRFPVADLTPALFYAPVVAAIVRALSLPI